MRNNSIRHIKNGRRFIPATVFPYLAVLFLAFGCAGGRGSETEALAGRQDTLRYARGLAVTHCEDYDMVSIRDPWDTLKTRHTYILIDRNREEPEDLPEGTVIKVPVEKAVIYTSVHTAMAEQLGVIDAVSGICEPQYIHSDSILKRIEDGVIADLGLSSAPNVEKIIDLDAEIIIASPFENAGYGAAEKIGVPIVEAADYMESHPLGRSEWVKFYGLLFGRSELADSLFEVTASRYNELKAMASKTTEKPALLLEKMYGSVWALPSDDSYTVRMHHDAGADYIFSGTGVRSSAPLAFEAVYDKAYEADVWVFKYAAASDYTLSSLKDENPLYAEFKAYREHKVFACNTSGLTYYDDITLHPDYILADFISIYHPELLPGYARRYYSEVKP